MFWTKTRANRKVALVKAKMQVSDEWVDISIANVSASGMMVKCACPPEVGSKARIQRRGISVEGLVVWATKTRFGLASFAEIDIEALLIKSDLQVDRRSTRREEVSRRGVPRFWCWQKKR